MQVRLYHNPHMLAKYPEGLFEQIYGHLRVVGPLHVDSHELIIVPGNLQQLEEVVSAVGPVDIQPHHGKLY